MDITEQSDFERENYIQSAIKKSSSSIKCGKLSPQGYCYNCEEDIEKPKLFCNGNCATQFEITNKHLRR